MPKRQTKITSNSQLAHAAGIHLTMASRIRSGKRRPSLTIATRVLDALELTDGEFREGIEAMCANGEAQAEFFDRKIGRYVPPPKTH